MTERYNVVIIGAGPAGYTAAIRAAQLGLKTACVDDWRNAGREPVPGGTCLNAGCIPSKTLLESSELYAHARERAAARGVQLAAPVLDLAAMMAHKDKVVGELARGIAALFKANGVAWLPGRGRLLRARQVEVAGHDGAVTALAADHVILACGSAPVELKDAPLTGDLIVDSAGALAFAAVPRRLGVIGAGVIGIELGSVWRRLGSEVVLLEAQEQFLTMADEQVAGEALRQFAAQGLDIRLGARVLGCEADAASVTVRYQDRTGAHTERFDRLVVAVGRRPATQGLAAEEAGLLLDEWGLIHVDEQCRTNLPGVYAVGDAVRGPMLAHKGMAEGAMAAELCAGRAARVNYAAIPAVIYTRPEIAWVGKTGQELKRAGVDHRAGVFPFAASGRARAADAAAGFVKVLADAATDRVLGAHMIGPGVSELIASAALAMEFGAAGADLALTMFPHPTLSEALSEAALALEGRAIHAAPARRKP